MAGSLRNLGFAKRREHIKQVSTTLSSGHFVYANPRIAWDIQVSVYSTLTMTLSSLLDFGQLAICICPVNEYSLTSTWYKAWAQAGKQFVFIINLPRDQPSIQFVYITVSTFVLILMPSPPRGYTTFPSDADLFYMCTSSASAEDLGINYVPPSQSSLRVGVIILGQDQVQLSDLAAVDLLSTLGRSRIGRLSAPASTLEEAVDEVDIRYVSVTGEGSFPVTSGARMPVTVS
jgi:hypothetical protein